MILCRLFTSGSFRYALAAIICSLLSSVQIVAQSNQSPSAIFIKARPSIVLIIGADESGTPTVQGSGFIIGPNRIVTNHHVVAGASNALAIFSDGGSSPVTSVVADSATKDLIILAAATGQRPAVVLGDELAMRQGDTVYAIGAPQGLDLTLTNGIVSAFRTIDDQFLIQTTAAIGHGSSGGPLLDREGKVVGITSALLTDTPGIYFSVGAGDLKRLLRSPQLMVLPFTEWAKQNTGRSVSAEGIGSSASGNVEQIEKLIQNKKFDEARVALQTLRAKEPDSATVHRLAGELDEQIGDWGGALRELGLSVEKNPSDAVGQFYYAISLFEVRRFDDALAHEVKSNELAPTAADQPFLALLNYSVRNYKQAEEIARKALTSNAQNETALTVLAGIAFHGASTQKDSWSKYAQQLMGLNSDNFWVHIFQGSDALKQSHVEEAKTAFNAAEKDDLCLSG